MGLYADRRAVCAKTAADGAPMATQRNVAQMRLPAQTDPMMAMPVGGQSLGAPRDESFAGRKHGMFQTFGVQDKTGDEFLARYIADLLFPLPFPVVVVTFQIWLACLANVFCFEALDDGHFWTGVSQLAGWTMVVYFFAVDAGFLRLFNIGDHKTIFGRLPSFKFVTFQKSASVAALYYFFLFGIVSWFFAWLSDLYYMPQPCTADDKFLLSKLLNISLTAVFAVCYLLARVIRVQHELDLVKIYDRKLFCLSGFENPDDSPSDTVGGRGTKYIDRDLTDADFTLGGMDGSAKPKTHRTGILLMRDMRTEEEKMKKNNYKDYMKHGTGPRVFLAWSILFFVLAAQSSLFSYVQELRFDAFLSHVCNRGTAGSSNSYGTPDFEGVRTTRAHGKFAIGKTFTIDNDVHMPCPVVDTCDPKGQDFVPHTTTAAGFTTEELRQQDMWDAFLGGYTDASSTDATEKAQRAMFTGWNTGFENAHESKRAACSYKYPRTGYFNGSLSGVNISFSDVANCRPGGMILKTPAQTATLRAGIAASVEAKPHGDQDLYGQQLAVSCPYGLASATCCDPLYNPSHWTCLMVPYMSYWNPYCNCKANTWSFWHAIFALGMEETFDLNGNSISS